MVGTILVRLVVLIGVIAVLGAALCYFLGRRKSTEDEKAFRQELAEKPVGRTGSPEANVQVQARRRAARN